MYDKNLVVQNLDVLQLVQEIEYQKAVKFRAIHFYRSKRPYVGGIMFSTYATADLVNSGHLPNTTKYPVHEYIRIACEEKDWQFAVDILWQLEETAIIYKKWSISLDASLPFLDFDHPKVRDALVQYLARPQIISTSDG